MGFFCVYSIGRPKHVRVMAGALEGDLFVGPIAEEHRGLLSLRYPMEHGIVTDWNDMERIWTYVYSKDRSIIMSCICLFHLFFKRYSSITYNFYKEDYAKFIA